MAENNFTKRNAGVGITTQNILDGGLNAFAIQLLVESFTDVLGNKTEPLKIVYRGVEIDLKVNQEAT